MRIFNRLKRRIEAYDLYHGDSNQTATMLNAITSIIYLKKLIHRGNPHILTVKNTYKLGR